MRPRQIIELLLTTGMMSFIMSGTMLAFKFGLNAAMLKTWASVYPIAWGVAIPGIIVTRKCVQRLVGVIFKTS